MAKTIPRRHQLFIDEYLKCFNATRAYLKIYPKSSYASAMASSSRLLSSDKISEIVTERLKELQMGPDEALKLLADQARGDIAEIMDVTSMGFNLDMRKAQEQGLTKLIKKVKQTTKTIIGKKPTDEDEEITTLEVELYDAQAALDKILRVHKKYTNPEDNPQRLEIIVTHSDRAEPSHSEPEATGDLQSPGEAQDSG
jgi:phage terminase small subunit